MFQVDMSPSSVDLSFKITCERDVHDLHNTSQTVAESLRTASRSRLLSCFSIKCYHLLERGVERLLSTTMDPYLSCYLLYVSMKVQ